MRMESGITVTRVWIGLNQGKSQLKLQPCMEKNKEIEVLFQ
jgi:hypothetical protein